MQTMTSGVRLLLSVIVEVLVVEGIHAVSHDTWETVTGKRSDTVLDF